MTKKMVLVQRTGATPLPNMEPDETELDDSVDDFNAVALALARMNEREHSYVMRQMNGRSSPTKGELTPRSIGTPRTPRSQFLSTPRTPRSNTLLGLDSTLLNDNVAFTQRNSAISHGYASPRQLTLSASHMSREGSGIPSRLRSLNGHRKISFDYDDTEEVVLEDLKYYRKPKVPIRRTEAMYMKACSICGIIPSQNYAKQTGTSRSIMMSNCSLSHLTVKPIAISLVKDKKIHTLDVSGNDIGPLGVMYLAEMLLENSTLYELNLSSTYPGEEGLRVLSDTLPKNRTVHVLRLESNNIEHTEAELLVKIIQNTPNLAELYLGHNNLGYEGGKKLAKALETNYTLRTLDLQWNHFRKESGKQLCLSMKLNEGLRKLNVSWNGLGKEGCIALAKSLPQNDTLVDLDLTCNRIDIIGLPFLLHGLVRNTGLERLNLGKNPLTTEGAKAIVKAITGATKMEIKELKLETVPVDFEFTRLVEKMKESRNIDVTHEEAMHGAVELQMEEHDPHDLNRFDPVMVLIEYIRIDNLRLIDLFQFFDTHNRGMLSREDLRDGVATIGLPLTEYHLDCIMKDIDSKRDGYIDLEEFMNAQKEMGKIITQRTTKAKGKGKEDLGLKELRQVLKELVEKRNTRNKEKASQRVRSARPSRDNIWSTKASASLTVTKPKYAKDVAAAKKMNSAWTGAVNKVKVMNAIDKSKQVPETKELPPIVDVTTYEKELVPPKTPKLFVTDYSKESPTLDREDKFPSIGNKLPDLISGGQGHGIGERQEFIENLVS